MTAVAQRAVDPHNAGAVVVEMEQAFDVWKTGFGQMCASGACNCLYSFCACTPCAVASARKNLDGSNWCFNCLCMANPVCLTIGHGAVARNIIRESYHIEGSCVGDVFHACPCVAWCNNTQLLGETNTRGPSNMMWGANRSPTEQPWEYGLYHCKKKSCSNCMYGCCCAPCAVASARQAFDGSNFCFNLMCVAPCMSRSIVREGYHLEGKCCGDVCKPLFCMPCVACQLLNEVEHRGKVTKTYVSVPSHKMAR